VKDRHRAFVGTRRFAHVFATQYEAVDCELPALLALERPDIVVMFGVATRARRVRVEERAHNGIRLFPDASGRRPVARTIVPGQNARLNSLPIARLAHMAGVAVNPSRNAGTYVCNYLYWRALEAAAQPGGPGCVVFVHLPPIRLATAIRKRSSKHPRTAPKRRTNWGSIPPMPRPRGQRAKQRREPRLDDLVRAGEAIVLATMALAAARRRRSNSILSDREQRANHLGAAFVKAFDQRSQREAGQPRGAPTDLLMRLA